MFRFAGDVGYEVGRAKNTTYLRLRLYKLVAKKFLFIYLPSAGYRTWYTSQACTSKPSQARPSIQIPPAKPPSHSTVLSTYLSPLPSMPSPPPSPSPPTAVNPHHFFFFSPYAMLCCADRYLLPLFSSSLLPLLLLFTAAPTPA